jgi:hypothetical protein
MRSWSAESAFVRASPVRGEERVEPLALERGIYPSSKNSMIWANVFESTCSFASSRVPT